MKEEKDGAGISDVGRPNNGKGRRVRRSSMSLHSKRVWSYALWNMGAGVARHDVPCVNDDMISRYGITHSSSMQLRVFATAIPNKTQM